MSLSYPYSVFQSNVGRLFTFVVFHTRYVGFILVSPVTQNSTLPKSYIKITFLFQFLFPPRFTPEVSKRNPLGVRGTRNPF